MIRRYSCPRHQMNNVPWTNNESLKPVFESLLLLVGDQWRIERPLPSVKLYTTFLVLPTPPSSSPFLLTPSPLLPDFVHPRHARLLGRFLGFPPGKWKESICYTGYAKHSLSCHECCKLAKILKYVSKSNDMFCAVRIWLGQASCGSFDLQANKPYCRLVVSLSREAVSLENFASWGEGGG